MRGFVFTIDMALAAIGVVLLLSILIQTVSPPIPSGIAAGRMIAKDATMGWFYTGSPSTLPLPLPDSYACDTGFRPRITTSPLTNPASDASWVTQENCVEVP